MAKHPVPKHKKSVSRTKKRYAAFVSKSQKKLLGAVNKMRGLEKKGNLQLLEKKKDQLVKKVKAD